MQYKVCSKEGEELFYNGLIVTSIDHKDAPDKIGYEHSFTSTDNDGKDVEVTYKYVNPVYFSEITTGDEAWKHKQDPAALEEYNEEFKYDAASFLYNVLEVSKDYDPITRGSKYTYVADKMTTEEAKAIFDKDQPAGSIPFFAIHGFATEANWHMKECSKATILFKDKKSKSKNVVIPTIWPSRGNQNPIAYRIDRGEFVPEAAIEFEKLMFPEQVKMLNVFPKKNLMCHSMGNYLLRKVAHESIKFDNIFMVAADVRHNLFDKEFIARFDKKGSGHNPNADEGLNIIKMLKKGENGKPVGKICALTNWYDNALLASTGVNYVNRMGQAGIGTYDKWIGGWGEDKELLHPSLYDGNDKYYENKNMYDDLDNHGDHGYHFISAAIDFYIEKIDETKE